MYAPVNDLRVYYEVHGEGEPLVLLHGANMSVEGMAPLLRPLAEYRRVIALELQGHGRTADVDRPLTYEGMADDTSALLDHLEIERADVTGFSLGGAVALQLAIRHPARVRKLVVLSSASAHDGMTAEMSELFRTMTPEMFKGTPMEEEYKRLAPDPDGFETLIWKLKELVATNRDWSEDVRAIAAPVLVIAGDSDIVRLDHIVQLFQSLPDAQLAVLPGTTHFDPGSRVLDRPALLDAMIRPFLEAQ